MFFGDTFLRTGKRGILLGDTFLRVGERGILSGVFF